MSHTLPSPGGAYRREHCAAARGSCRDYFRIRCAVIFFSPSLQSLVCLHNLICHNMAIFTSRFCAGWRLVCIIINIYLFLHKIAMQLRLRNILARATGRTATLA